jgi:hypothetical protein
MFQVLNIFRSLVVATSIAAWLVASNHCVLAATPFKDQTGNSACPMHAQKQNTPQPENGNGCGDLPCCKNLQATGVSTAKTVTKPIWLGALHVFFIPVVAIIQRQHRPPLSILDTGPPGENNFTESVLQRSILAHAPPVSLS